ncbi:lytic transglycosylase domain-containing protein [Bailinhaonella thermotolerans]|uniref:Lytic transglycosylase domain-containing protein n=1 Tax=Bailinhaonella thermotolerans TaxID=1070861 RepID=A0A3A4AXD7_9ACTN|nr:lytic transglycosylase domain-containing protein [Bailinhaonella thermotolerans]
MKSPPQVFAISQTPVDRALAGRIAGLDGVDGVVVLDGGAVAAGPRPLSLLAVDPARFRPLTPPGTAAEDGLWRALERGELIVSSAAQRDLGLRLGADHTVAGRRVRVGGSAPLGLPGVDGIVNPALGTRLGLLPGVAVLVGAQKADSAKVGRGVRGVLGRNAQVVALGGETAEPAPPAPSPTPPPEPERPRPLTYLELYKSSAHTCPGLHWSVLAAIGQVESDHGRNSGPSSAGALGPMQFLPSTWRSYGVDGDGDGRKDVHNAYDAVPAAAIYLCKHGATRGREGLAKAVWHYNHSDAYVRKVLALADAYARSYP